MASDVNNNSKTRTSSSGSITTPQTTMMTTMSRPTSQHEQQGVAKGNSSSSSSPLGNELTRLLARAPSFDAKFRIDINSPYSAHRQHNRTSGEGSEITPRKRSETKDIELIEFSSPPPGYVQLPGRFRVTPSSGGTPMTSSDGIPDERFVEEMEEDLDQALHWIRQEIRTLRQQDQTLMRQLQQLGTVIHDVTGDADRSPGSSSLQHQLHQPSSAGSSPWQRCTDSNSPASSASSPSSPRLQFNWSHHHYYHYPLPADDHESTA